MKDRMRLFLQLKSYSAVAKIVGVDTSTIRKQMIGLKHDGIQAIIKEKNRYKGKQCYMCFRPAVAKGLCQACYRYSNYVCEERRTRRII